MASVFGVSLNPAADEPAAHTRALPAPTLEALTSTLYGVLCSGVAIPERQPNVHEGSFHSEIITCRLSNGSERRLLCKYSAGADHNCYGHRGGISYEAEVYTSILSGIQLATPAFYGHRTNPATSECWLILDFLEDGVRIHHSVDPGTMRLAATWIGLFHAVNEPRLAAASMRFLNRYDFRYYSGWSHRTWLYSKPFHRRYAWITEACDMYAQAIEWLLAQRPTVIHGEYYPFNVLIAGGEVCPVDWESAAIAAGEIDLASLTERWPEESVREMELGYKCARWPAGAPADFEKTLAAARLYIAFRWLGDRPERTASEESAWRFEQMRSASERWKSLGAG